MRTHETTEFDCQDCGAHVYEFSGRPAPVPPRCALCGALHDVPNRAVREDIRRRVYDTAAMEHWVAVGSYIDEACSERPCDRCGKPYRGLSLYCCHACALADAGALRELPP